MELNLTSQVPLKNFPLLYELITFFVVPIRSTKHKLDDTLNRTFRCKLKHTHQSRTMARSQDTLYVSPPIPYLNRTNHPPTPAFTRPLTILYSTILLSLFTSIQISLLGRAKYVQSIIRDERDQRVHELLGGSAGSVPWVDIDEDGDDDDEEMQNGGIRDEDVDEGMEMLYLTLSWWMLHVGWKDVGERVRRGVEEVLDGCARVLLLGKKS